MSITARTPEGKIIQCSQFKNKYELVDTHPSLFSPFYPENDVPVTVVWGTVVTAHFRVQAEGVKQAVCYTHHKESPEHNAGKNWVFNHLKTTRPEKGLRFVFEHPVILPSGQKRIIDVAVLKGDKIIEAHEIQLSPQTIAELNQRTNDYRNAGIAVEWYFGDKCKPLALDWQIDLFGYETLIQFAVRKEAVASW